MKYSAEFKAWSYDQLLDIAPKDAALRYWGNAVLLRRGKDRRRCALENQRIEEMLGQQLRVELANLRDDDGHR